MSLRTKIATIAIACVALASFSALAIKVRVADGNKSPLGYTADPHYGEMAINDGTGVTITTPTTATAIASATLLVTSSSNGLTMSPTNGTMTATRSGVYTCYAQISNSVGVNSQVMTLKFIKNTSTAMGAPMNFTAASTAIALNPLLRVQSLVSLAVGDTVKATITADTGNVVIKAFTVGCQQLTDAGSAP